MRPPFWIPDNKNLFRLSHIAGIGYHLASRAWPWKKRLFSPFSS